MSKKKICFIAQFAPPVHGLSKAVDTLYNSVLKDEFDFEKVNITNNKHFPRNLLAISKSNADLFYFTISQSEGGNLRDLIILKLLWMQHKKCLIHLHGGYYRELADHDMGSWQRKANYNAISQLEGAIVLGESFKPIFQGMLPDEKIFVVPNCADDEYLMNDEEFEEKIATLPERTVKHVLYLNNFIRSKGYPEVLDMARLEKERVEAGGERKLHFDFAGRFFEETEKKFFFEYIKYNGLESYVTYHGVVSGDKKRMLLKACDIFALLTSYPLEGQPISILEAMGNGMMIVTTDHAGIPEIVKNGLNGIVVNKSADIYTIYNNLSTLDCCMVEKENRKTVQASYTEHIYLQNMRRVFEICTLEDYDGKGKEHRVSGDI